MDEKTKSEMAFINAAGELFATRGIDAVPVKEIARRAGIDASMIKYYFGSKDGLVKAVIEHAVKPWSDDNLVKYYRENANLLETRDGQTVFVTGMVEQIFRVLTSWEDANWGKSFVLQLIQRPNSMRQEIIDRHLKPSVKAFCEIYRKITGNDDFDSAFCWFLFIISPMYIYSGSPGLIDSLHPEGGVANGFERRLQFLTTSRLLSGLGLA